MARTYNITRRYQTKQRKNGRNQEIETPTNTKTLKSFLGAIQYFAKFIPNLSEKTDNMRQLLKKGTKWDRTTDRKADFNKIKQELTKLPCVAHYNSNKENIGFKKHIRHIPKTATSVLVKLFREPNHS